jgi:small-conductance mechanosensitive channel
LTDLVSKLAAYAPNLIAAAALIVGGLVAARIGRGAVAKTATLMRLEHQADTLAAFSYALIITIAMVMALEQIGIEGRVLELVLAVTLGSVLAAAGLAFALGARSAVSNIVAARYVTQLCQMGQEIEIEGIRGTVAALTATAVIIDTDKGSVIVPAARFHDSLPVLLKDS